jgi:hypothetical protein
MARRYRDVVAAVAEDQGGVGRLCEARLQLIRRYSAAACLASSSRTRSYLSPSHKQFWRSCAWRSTIPEALQLRREDLAQRVQCS